jgi:hypothetical protein
VEIYLRINKFPKLYENVRKEFRNFDDAREFVRSLNLKTQKEWQIYAKTKPKDIPSIPNRTYKKEWISWGDFLGTGRIATQDIQYHSFEEARKFVRSLNLKTQKEWFQYCKSGNKPNNIPRNLNRTYEKEWKGYGDFLGTGRIATQDIQYRSFEDTRKFVRKLGLKSGSEWTVYCKSDKKPQDIPYDAKKIYGKKWKSMGDWLGTGFIATYKIKYRSFEEARKFSQQLHLNDNKMWSKFCKSGNKPNDMPSAPEHQYKNKGWISWGDFLGTGRIANYNKTYRSFDDAREFVRKLYLKSTKDWGEYCTSGEKPDDIPIVPTGTYKKEWNNWGDWLGTGIIAPQKREYRSFADARKFIQSLGLKGTKDWEKYCKSGKKPDDIPAAPWTVYKKWKRK